MKFIHLADCHLASQKNFSSDTGEFLRKKTWEAFDRILKENKDADFALIGGDLFERSLFTTKDYMKLFDQIKNFGKNIYYVTGNHDYIGRDNEVFFEDKPNNLKIFPTNRLEFFQEGRVRIYGISYEDRIFTRNFPNETRLDDEYFNILLVHGVVDEDKSTYLNLDLDKLMAMGFSYVGLGHIHKPRQVADTIYYCGTIEAKDFGEDMNYGYLVYDRGQIQRKIISQVKFTSLSLKTSAYLDQDDLIRDLEKELDKKINFLRLKLIDDGSFPIDKDEIKRSLNLFYLEIEKERDYQIEDLKVTYKDSLLSRFLDQVEALDSDNHLNQRAKELGIDAILRSKYD